MLRSRRTSWLRFAGRIPVYTMLLAASALFLLPLAWMLSTAVKDPRLIYADPPVWVPIPPTLANFVKAWQMMPFLTYLRNSLVLALLILPGALLVNSLAGFAFASLPARGRSLWFGVMIATLAVPVQVTIIPSFLLFVGLGWTNTFAPLVIPQWTGNAIYIFLYRQFFRRIPPELYDSAELDGCSAAGVYWHIAMPLARPVSATVATFAFLASWNDFQNPLIYLTDGALYTLPLGLALFQSRFMTQFQYLMPMAILSLVPVLAVYLLAQRHIVTVARLNPLH